MKTVLVIMNAPFFQRYLLMAGSLVLGLIACTLLG